ncbi:unnamed protein product [Sphenostylis stenocarpa]|uniref:Uncharacterized protein n=1 Tax=Sphenostylis stenocarpa TaxID=92480 RepID=A0AA86S5I3_9FABA|nr:unnamed protein product [Sphenostylis stenocarpa]
MSLEAYNETRHFLHSKLNAHFLHHHCRTKKGKKNLTDRFDKLRKWKDRGAMHVGTKSEGDRSEDREGKSEERTENA